MIRTRVGHAPYKAEHAPLDTRGRQERHRVASRHPNLLKIISGGGRGDAEADEEDVARVRPLERCGTVVVSHWSLIMSIQDSGFPLEQPSEPSERFRAERSAGVCYATQQPALS